MRNEETDTGDRLPQSSSKLVNDISDVSRNAKQAVSLKSPRRSRRLNPAKSQSAAKSQQQSRKVLQSRPKQKASAVKPVEDIFIVEKLVEKRRHKGKIEYLVEWVGWEADYNSWEPKSHFIDKNLIKEFEAQESSLGGHTSCSPKKLRCSSGFYSASESRCSSSVGASPIVKDEKLDEMINLGKYVINKTNITITKADINCLAPGAFLNDTIIDFYCNYLLEYYLKTPEQKDRVYLFNAFFYKTYTQVRSVSTKSQTQFSKPIEGASNGNGISKSKKKTQKRGKLD